MPLDSTAVGKTFAPTFYAVGRENVREYARAVGETDPVHQDVNAARASGYVDIVAPAMFAVVYEGPAILRAFADPQVGIDLERMVHGSQEFVFGRPVVAGDEITTRCSVEAIYEQRGHAFYVLGTFSHNQDGAGVCTGTWTTVVRGVDDGHAARTRPASRVARDALQIHHGPLRRRSG